MVYSDLAEHMFSLIVFKEIINYLITIKFYIFIELNKCVPALEIYILGLDLIQNQINISFFFSVYLLYQL